MLRSLVGSEMCIRDRAAVVGVGAAAGVAVAAPVVGVAAAALAGGAAPPLAVAAAFRRSVCCPDGSPPPSAFPIYLFQHSYS